MARVFLCYSHADESARERLCKHLDTLDHLGIEAWSDHRIAGGTDWLPEITRELDACDAAILLVSPDFLNSRFIKTVEVPELLKGRHERGAVIMPLIVRPCAWKKKDWLARMQVRPWEGKPLMAMKPVQRDAVLAELAIEVLELTGQRPKAAPMAATGAETWHSVELSLNADYDPNDNASLDALEQAFRAVTGYQDFKIRRKAPGSLKLYVDLPAEALQRLKAALALGFLSPPGVTITSESAKAELIRLRGQTVLLDEAIALFFERDTKVINQARDRNQDRFPPDYAFQLTQEEWADLKSQFVTAKPGRGGRRTPPWAYSERGIAMLATVLRTPRATEAAKLIVETFVTARRAALPVPPHNHDGIGDPATDTADKRAFKQRLAEFDGEAP